MVQSAVLHAFLCSACAGFQQWAGCSWAKGGISELITFEKRGIVDAAFFLSWMSLFNVDYLKIRRFCFRLHFVLNDVS